MRTPVRSFATLLLAVGVATCADAPIAGVKQAPGPTYHGFAGIGFIPAFSQTAQYAAAHAADFGITFNTVRVLLRGTPDTSSIVKDTTVSFDATSPDLTLDLVVPVQTDGQRFDAGIEYRSPTGVIFFSGHLIVTSYPLRSPTPPAPQQITINYVGPGAGTARIAITPKTVNLVAPQGNTFSVAAFDSSGASISAPPLAWSSSDVSVGTVSTSGQLTTTGRRGAVTITATTPTGISDNAAATVTLPAAAIALVSGGGQSGKVGATLGTAAAVQVSASDGVGVPGVNVVFAPPAGGSVGTTSATTDANGRASTTLRLGSAVGPQSFAATAGAFAVAIPATATAGDPAAIAAIAGGGQADTVRHALSKPLVVHVSDQFNNPVGGAAVAWSRVGAGALSAASTTTGDDGNASVSYTLGAAAGSETISASVAGVSSPVSFTVSAVAGAAASLAITAGENQTGIVNTAVAIAPAVRVTDAANNPIQGVSVAFTPAAGSGSVVPSGVATTDALGVATLASWTLGTTAGAQSLVVSVGGVSSVTVHATATAGAPAALRITTPPSASASSNLPFATQPVVQVTDKFGNTAAAGTLTIVAVSSNAAITLNNSSITTNPTTGVASFTALTPIGTGTTQVSFRDASGALTSAPVSVAVAAQVATQLLVVDPTTLAPIATDPVPLPTLTAGVPPVSLPRVRIVDVGGNGVANVRVDFAVAGTTQTGAPVNLSSFLVTGADGTVAFVGTATVAGTYTVTATSGALAGSPRHGTFIVNPGGGIRLSFGTPTMKALAGIPTPAAVLVTDSVGNPIVSGPQSTATITLSVASVAPAGGSITNATAIASAGVAVFPTLTYSAAGTYTITASGTGALASTTPLTTTVSNPPVLAAISPATISAAPGAPVAATDLPHVRATVDGSPVAGVTVLFSTNCGTIALGQATGASLPVVTSSTGDAAISGWTAPGTPVSCTLTAGFAGSTLPAVTFRLNVGADVTTQLAIAGVPSGAVQLAFVDLPTITVTAQNVLGAIVPGATGNVTLSLQGGGGAGVLSGTTVQPLVSGVATFTGLQISAPGAAYSLKAVFGNVTATSATFVVGPAPVITIASNNGAFGMPSAVVAAAPLVKLTNGATAVAGVPVTFTVTGGGGSLAAQKVTTNTLGQAAAPSWTFGAAGVQTMTATISGGASVTFADTLVSAASFVAGSVPATIRNGRPITGTLPKVQLSGNGHPVSVPNVAITLGVAPPPINVIGAAVRTPKRVVTQRVPLAGSNVSRTVTTFAAGGLPTLAGAVTVNTAADGSATFGNLTANGLIQDFHFTSAAAGVAGDASGDLVLLGGDPFEMSFLFDEAGLPRHVLADVVGARTPEVPAVVQIFDDSLNVVDSAAVHWSLTNCVGGASLSLTGLVSTSTTLTDFFTGQASPVYQLPNVQSSCTITATATNAKGSPIVNSGFTFASIVFNAGWNAWMANVGNSYADGRNWTSGGVPTTGDSIFVGRAASSYPVIGNADVGTSVARVTLEDVASLDLTGRTLLVAGDISTGSNGGIISINGSGSLAATGSSCGRVAQIQGKLPTLVVGTGGECGSFALSGDAVADSVSVLSTFSISGHKLGVIGGATVGQGQTFSIARLAMNNVGDLVTIGRSLAFSGGDESNLLTSGTIVIGGNFSETTPLISNGTLMRFMGAARITQQGTQFANLDLINAAAQFDVPASINGNLSITSSRMAAADTATVTVGGAVTVDATSDLSGVATLRVAGNTFPVYNNSVTTAPAFTEVLGTYALSGSRTVGRGLRLVGSNIALGGGTLTVGGDLDVQSNPFAAAGSLVSGGTLNLRGNVTVDGSSLSALSSATLSFTGVVPQSVQITNSQNAAQLGAVRINKGAAVSFVSNVFISGATLDVLAGGQLIIPSGVLSFNQATGRLALHSSSHFTITGLLSGLGPTNCTRNDPTLVGGIGTAPTIDGGNVVGFTRVSCTLAIVP